MMATSPPVPLPPIKSKYSHGRGAVEAPLSLPMPSMISRKTNSEESPRAPPPSREIIRGLSSFMGTSTMRKAKEPHSDLVRLVATFNACVRGEVARELVN